MAQELLNIRDYQTAWFLRALEEDLFETWYQPVVDTTGHRLLGHECLIRFSPAAGGGPEPPASRPGRRVFAGAEILDAARAHNRIGDFDAYARALAVRSAALQLCLSRADGRSDPGVFFINVMPSFMEDPAEEMGPIRDMIAAADLEPEDFVFEVVDADLVGDSARLRRLAEYLRRERFGFALDNVGIGLDPIGQIRDLQPDFLKLDQRVCWHLEQPAYGAMVGRLVDLAEKQGIGVIGTGVERKRVMENLWLLGVTTMQGYVFGRPSPDVARTSQDPLEEAGESDLLNLARALMPSTPAPEPELESKRTAAREEYHADIFLIHSNTR